jgi:hypothetical protein
MSTSAILWHSIEQLLAAGHPRRYRSLVQESFAGHSPSPGDRRLRTGGTPTSLGGALLYPVYVRGEAYLALRQGSQAAVEFQKILDHAGIMMNSPVGALAHIGLGRAYALEAGVGSGLMAAQTGRPQGAPLQPEALAKARTAYQDFFALWKDADPDIPILKQARAEYAKLQ